MSIGQIFKQAWRNTVSYRGLWLLGVLIALTTFSGSWTYMLGGNDNEPVRDQRGITIQRGDDETFWEAAERTFRSEFAAADHEIERFFATEFDVHFNSHLATYLITFFAAALLLYVIGRIVRYVSEVGLIRMIDHHAETGEKLRGRRGFRLGWSRAAWQLFFIDLIITLAAIAGVLALFTVIFSPIALWVNSSETVIIISAFVTAAFFFIGLLVAIAGSALVTLLRLLARRACVLDGMGVTGSIRHAYGLLRQNLKDLVLTGLPIVAIQCAWPLLIGLTMLALFAVGLLLGAVPTSILVNLSDPATLPAAILGGIFFLLVLVAPLVLLEGLLQVFYSSVWTLAYRQLAGRQVAPEAAAPAATLPDAALPVPSA